MKIELEFDIADIWADDESLQDAIRREVEAEFAKAVRRATREAMAKMEKEIAAQVEKEVRERLVA